MTDPLPLAPMMEDIDACYRHSDQPAVGWAEIRGVESRMAVGVCASCLPPQQARMVDVSTSYEGVTPAEA